MKNGKTFRHEGERGRDFCVNSFHSYLSLIVNNKLEIEKNFI